MNHDTLHILLVEDNPVEAMAARNWLGGVEPGCSLTHVQDAAAAIECLRTTRFDAALVDLCLPDCSGIALLERIVAADPQLPIVVLTGLDDESLAVKAINRGAQDYLLKGQFTGALVVHAIRYARERKRAEESLRASETKYRTLFNSMTDAVMMMTTDHRFLGGNPATLELFGCRDEKELVSRTPVDFSPEFQSDGTPSSVKAPQMVAIALEKGSHSFEWTHKRMDGREFLAWVMLTRMELGGETLLQAAVRDITERKRSEESLRLANTMLRTQQETAPDGILVVDEDRKIVSYNQRFVDMWGMPADCLEAGYDQPVLQWVLKRLVDPAEFLARVQYLYSHRDEKSHEEIELVDGITFDRYSAPMFAPDGRYYGRIWYFRDITERKRAEDSLRQEQQFSESLVESLPGIFYLYSYPENRLVLWNRQHETIFGFTAEEMKGRLVTDWHLPAAKDAVLEAVAKAMEEGQGSVESILVAKDGRQLPFFLTGVRFEARGRSFLMGTGIDISDRKRAEESLRESERRLSMAMEMSNAGIWEWNLKTDEVRFDARFHAILGYEPGELPTNLQEWILWHHPDDRDAMMARADAHFRGDSPNYESEHRIRNKAGGWTWVLAAGQVANRTEGPGSQRFLGLAVDITDRKNAEEVIHREKLLSESIINSLPGIFYLFDENVRNCRWNKNLELVTGLSGEEISQITTLDLIAPPDREYIQRKIQAAFTQGTADGEARLNCKDGRFIPYYFTAHQIVLNGRPFVLGIGMDITERKQNEVALRESESKLREAQAMARLGYWKWNIKTGEVEWSDEVFRIFQQDPRKFVPNIDAILALSPWPEDRNRGAELIQKLAATREGGAYDQRFLRPDGSTGYYHSTYQGRFDEDGNLAFVVGAALDITERKQAEEELKRHKEHLEELVVQRTGELVAAKEVAEAANRAKSDFLATISHEIRTPMTAILGYADLLMDPQLNASSRNNYATTIRRSGEHLLCLINDILDLSKIEAGKVTLEFGRCRLAMLLAEVGSLLRPRAMEHGISFAVEYTGPIPETICTDGARLRQAIINLAGNAIKFTEKGSVRIVASFLPGGRDWQPAVQIDVIDTGIGIRPEALPRLFRPFSQGDATVARKYGGTGLGLAISYHISQMLGGELTVKSELGKGSDFTLVVPTGNLDGIPMLQNPTEIMHDDAEKAWTSEVEDLTGVRILLAEDGLDNRELIQAVLRRVGASVDTAENGRVAVRKALSQPFDLVLMDMNMPEMDGYEATAVLRDRGYSVPIVALTANAMIGDSERCRLAGCDEYLTKPIDRKQLIRIIAALAGSKAMAGRSTSLDNVPKSAPDAMVEPSNSDASTVGEGSMSMAEPETRERDNEPLVSEFINDPEMVPIIERFVGRLADQLDAMHHATAKHEHDELRRLAHKLKGAGGSYGYPRLTDACKVLEDAAMAQDDAAETAAIQKVDALVHAIKNGRETAKADGAMTS